MYRKEHKRFLPRAIHLSKLTARRAIVKPIVGTLTRHITSNLFTRSQSLIRRIVQHRHISPKIENFLNQLGGWFNTLFRPKSNQGINGTSKALHEKPISWWTSGGSSTMEGTLTAKRSTWFFMPWFSMRSKPIGSTKVSKWSLSEAE